MKQTAVIRLFQPGIVLFDPQVFHAFVQAHLAPGEQPFQRFVDDPALGDKATRCGAALPMYPVEEDDYAVFVESEVPPEGARRHFTHAGAPLRLESGVVIAADLGAVMNWEAEFFLHYRHHLQDRLLNTDYLEVAPGCYDVSINGYTRLPQPHPPQGYGLVLRRVDVLPDTRADDDVDFALPVAPPQA